MIRGGVGAAVLGAAFLLAGCGAGGAFYAIPHPIADAEPVPTACPTKICPRPSPTHSQTTEPEPEPTGTATSGGGSKPGPRRTNKPGTKPTVGPSAGPTTPGVIGPGAPTPPPGSKFAAFVFHQVPFDQAFPLDPPPPPPPIAEAIPSGLVVIASMLAAGVAASAGIATRRMRGVVV